MCSPYLKRPVRTEAQARAEREARRAAGEWMPWEVESEMYRDPEDDGPTIGLYTGGCP